MATRLEGRVTGVYGTQYDIIIDDAGTFTPPVIDFDLSGEGLKWSWRASESHPHAPIIASSVEFSILIDSSISTQMNAFISDLAGDEEGRFRLIIQTTSSETVWIGYILTDQIQRQDPDWADIVSKLRIRAVDGINRLKNIDFPKPGNTRRHISEYLFDAIDQIGHKDFFSASDSYLKLYCKWYESNMSAALTDNPLALVKVGREAFAKKDNKGEQVYISCYKVIETIATIFGARFYYSGGSYRFDQVGEFRNNGSLYQHVYFKSRLKNTTNTSVDIALLESNDVFTRAGNGSYSYYAPLRDVEITSKHRLNRNYLQGATWSNTGTALEELGTVGTTDAVLDFSGTFNTTLTYTTSDLYLPARLIFLITIRVTVGGTDYYLKRDYTTGVGTTLIFEEAEWTTNSSDRYRVVLGPYVHQTGDLVEHIAILSPLLPTDSNIANIFVQVQFLKALQLSDNSDINPSEYTLTWAFINTLAQVQADDDTEEVSEGTVAILINPTYSNNSQTLELETLIADGPNLINDAIMTVHDGTDDIASSEWTKGLTGDTKRIQHLLLEEVMKYRLRALQRWNGRLLEAGAYSYHNIAEFSTNDQYIPLSCSFELSKREETWKGEWIKAAYNDSPILENDDGVDISDLPGEGGGGGGIDSPSPGTKYVPADAIAATFSTGGQLVAVTDTMIAVGDTVTSIGINPIGKDGVIESGDIIKVVGINGVTQQFTVASDVGASDTSISVNSQAATDTFGSSSFITMSTGDYITKVQNISGGAFSTTSNVTSNSPGDPTTDDFAFGSPSLNDTGNNAHNNRMIFDKSLGAFLVGSATSTQWDSRGFFIFHAGVNNRITGYASAAIGSENINNRNYSLLVGYQNDTTQPGSTGSAVYAFGWQCYPRESFVLAHGYRADAYLYGMRAHASGYFNAQGDCQAAQLVARAESTGTGTATLHLDGSAKTLNMPTSCTWNMWVDIMAIVQTVGSGTTTIGSHDIAKYNCMYSKSSGGTVSKFLSELIGTRVTATSMGSPTIYFGGAGGTVGPVIQWTPDASKFASDTVVRIVATIRFTQVTI